MAADSTQVGKFKLPEADRPAVYRDNKELYWHIGEEHVSTLERTRATADQQVPDAWRFPQQFRGEGIR